MSGAGDAFAVMRQRVFADRHLGRDAVYYPPGSADGRAVRVRLADRTREIGIGGGLVRADSLRAEVLRAQLPDPVKDGRLVIGERAYRVVNVPARDEAGVWTLGLAEIKPRA